jgi:predicted adenine nucleotide alpha hydrolase (AANH) superfamily ATPase
MKMLLHVCCGPCACATIPFWRNKGVELVDFFYNPNIHPLLEYRRRLVGAREIAEVTQTSLVVDEAYDPQAWFASVSGESGSRCERCIGMRLDRSAQEAVAQGCKAFSTTLAISPWQDHDVIRTRGGLAAEKHGVEFLYEDLRPEYPASRRLSRELGIYRQKYCGCLVSEWERYRDS